MKTVIEMAREAGFEEGDGACAGKLYSPHTYDSYSLTSELRRFAALVRADEREACAKVCDDWPNGRDDVYSIGEAIRARSNT